MWKELWLSFACIVLACLLSWYITTHLLWKQRGSGANPDTPKKKRARKGIVNALPSSPHHSIKSPHVSPLPFPRRAACMHWLPVCSVMPVPYHLIYVCSVCPYIWHVSYLISPHTHLSVAFSPRMIYWLSSSASRPLPCPRRRPLILRGQSIGRPYISFFLHTSKTDIMMCCILILQSRACWQRIPPIQHHTKILCERVALVHIWVVLYNIGSVRLLLL